MIHMSQVKVPLERIVQVSPAQLLKRGQISEEEKKLVRQAAAKLLRIAPENIRDFKILKKSMDARKKQQIHYTYQVSFCCPKEEKTVQRYGKNDACRIPQEQKKQEIVRKPVKSDTPPVVVGFGPAGMFAALELARAGLEPVVLERGLSVEERQQEVDKFWAGEALNPECNVQFGEGGAGTFSDGKLNTMTKDSTGRNQKVLQTLVDFGAPSEILYLQKPHIGTDLLKGVVRAVREEIIRLGGQMRFGTRLDDIVTEEGKLVQIILSSHGKKETLPCNILVLATGHSARDTFYRLRDSGIYMEAKSFAVGVRIEHPQEMIGQNQYGAYYTKLPAADYKLTYQTGKNRGVYSFCMCPGGYVVNASSEEGGLAVNGMSYYNRDGINANSAIVVTVSPEDFGSTDALAGVEFQRKYERLAYEQAGGRIPVQLLADFMANQKSTAFGSILPQTKGEYAFGNVRAILPKAAGDSIAEAMQAFDRRLKGYAREDAVLSGIESRTSSPVRMVRDETMQANIQGVYPCGEGAGYAGGITSAAMDGLRIADAVLQNITF